MLDFWVKPVVDEPTMGMRTVFFQEIRQELSLKVNDAF
jgi:hypothetical protein